MRSHGSSGWASRSPRPVCSTASWPACWPSSSRPDRMLSTLATVTVTAASSSSYDSGGSLLVKPGVGLMIWTLIVFFVSMFLLARLAFPRISEALDKRQRAIEESIDIAERTKQEAEQLLAEYRERLTQARPEDDEDFSAPKK